MQPAPSQHSKTDLLMLTTDTDIKYIFLLIAKYSLYIV